MAEYALSCQACGGAFTAHRRHARACSKRCQQQLYRGATPSDMGSAESLHALPSRRDPDVGSYALCRGSLTQLVIMTVTRAGEIADGPFQGRTIGQMLQTSAREGWLAYKLRPDGWYSAEWWPTRKSIALCGPLAGLPSADIEAAAVEPTVAMAA